MIIKAKIRKIGNSLGILIPKENLIGFKEGDYLELEVITNDDTRPVITTEDRVETASESEGNTELPI